MAKKESLAEELKALGAEVRRALQEVRSSKEFKDLEKEIGTSVRRVSESFLNSLRAARKSESAGRIKQRVGRVVKIGAKKGGEEAARAQERAKARLKKLNKAFRKLANKLR